MDNQYVVAAIVSAGTIYGAANGLDCDKPRGHVQPVCGGFGKLDFLNFEMNSARPCIAVKSFNTHSGSIFSIREMVGAFIPIRSDT